MTVTLRSVPNQPGLYSASGLTEDPDNPGFYLVPDGMVETSPGSGIYEVETLGPYAPALTAAPDGSPAPYVSVAVDEAPDGTATLTVYRTAGGRRFKVRGMTGVPWSGGVEQRDYEAPDGMESSYQVEFLNSDGVLVQWSDATSVMLSWLGRDEAVFHNPLDPASAVTVKLLSGAADSIVRSTSVDVARVPTRSVGISFPGTRGGVQGAVLDCYTETRADGEKFDALFGAYDTDALSIVCVRARRETWLPAPLFAFVGKPGLHPLGIDGEAVRWSLSGDETAPPTPAVITPLLTYDDFTAYYTANGGAYDSFTAAYSSYNEASRDYSIAGLG